MQPVLCTYREWVEFAQYGHSDAAQIMYLGTYM